MGSIKLLDCTLRDGGYINDWRFGELAIRDITRKLSSTGIDVFEIGFLKNEEFDKDRTVFNSIHQISDYILPKQPGLEYAAMIEVVNPIPLDMIETRTDSTVDIIRVIVWKTKQASDGTFVDALQEGYEYCKGIVEKGYKLCIQPARIDQYSYKEFADLVMLFNQLDPMAIYVVDSWGTQYESSLMEYMRVADMYLKPGISLGYHGHNNLMQAYSVAQTLVNSNIQRDIMIDASVYGIGRGAGNLNLELFAKYMNDTFGKSYDIIPMIEVYEDHIKQIYNECPWGYSLPFFLTAKYNANPNYASYYGLELNLSSCDIASILRMLSDVDKIIYTKDKADYYLHEYIKKQNSKGN